jgi:hypothetical protein
MRRQAPCPITLAYVASDNGIRSRPLGISSCSKQDAELVGVKVGRQRELPRRNRLHLADITDVGSSGNNARHTDRGCAVEAHLQCRVRLTGVPPISSRPPMKSATEVSAMLPAKCDHRGAGLTPLRGRARSRGSDANIRVMPPAAPSGRAAQNQDATARTKWYSGRGKTATDRVSVQEGDAHAL